MGRHSELLAGVCAVILGVAVGHGGAWAEGGASAKQYAPSQKAKLVRSIAPEQGFVDDPFTFDRAGSRLAYVASDAGTSSHLVVVDSLQRTELYRVNFGKFTLKPKRVEFALDGEHFLLWSEDASTAEKRVALINSKGRIVRKFGPAKDIVRTDFEGQDALVVHKVSSLKKRNKKHKEGSPLVRHSVAVYAIRNGKTIGKKSNLDLDEKDKSTALDFSFRYWAKDFTVAVGIKGGVWDRKEDQRSPDFEGWYDMTTATFSKRLPIKDIVKHRERMERLAKYAKHSRDIVVRHDLSGIDLVKNGEFHELALAEPFHHYDHTSLVTQHSSSGSLFFTLTIDPVHPDAAAKRRAVKPWMDLYEYMPQSKKAVRRARLLPPKGRRHTWRATSTHWALVPRHVGFDRGGTQLLLYVLD
ncbi:MAG: hypothetical protein GY811_23665 [Myxococcales bacterium]|nr:hypothetical protein [Myxococcales bacterium]